MKPLISIIIPTCNRPDALRTCLEHLFSNDPLASGESFEILVTDDARDPKLLGELASLPHPVRYLPGPQRGPAANRNEGARNAAAPWLAFLDDDCIPSARWIASYAEALAGAPHCTVFEGRTLADRPQANIAEVAPINESGGYLWSCNFLIAREVFLRFGGFDERFPHAAMEDVDLHHRLRIGRQKIEFVPGALAIHPWRTVRSWSWFRIHGESTLIYLRLHPDEYQRINARYYLRVFASRLRSHFLGGLKVRNLDGWRFLLFDSLHSLRMALILARTKPGAT